MAWHEVLPEQGTAPTGLDDPPLVELARTTATAVLLRDRAGTDAVRAWPAGQRRLLAAQTHLGVVRATSPDEGAAVVLGVLVDDRIRWSRADLAWALRTAADEWGHYDGGSFRLPALIAAALPAGELAGFRPALQSLAHHVRHQTDMPVAVRRLTGELLGTALGRLTGELPEHLLHAGDRFGPLARKRLARQLADPATHEVLRHAATLARPVPGQAWLRAATPAPVVRDLLDCYQRYGGRLHEDNDVLLRGLAWIQSLDPAGPATGLLALVATAAASAPTGSGRPYAPRTAAAVVEILAARRGETAVRTLDWLAGIVRNRALLSRVQAARELVGQPSRTQSRTSGMSSRCSTT